MHTLDTGPQEGSTDDHVETSSHAIDPPEPGSPGAGSHVRPTSPTLNGKSADNEKHETNVETHDDALKPKDETNVETHDDTLKPKDEIGDLRQQLAELTKKVDSLTQDSPKLTRKSTDAPTEESENKPDKPLSLDVKRLSFQAWQPLRGLDRDELKSNVLVVYYGNSSGQMRATDQTGERASSKPSASGLRVEHEVDPKRVQINSRPLLDELEFISGCAMNKVPTVFVPPFKIFVEQRDKIAREIKKKQDLLEEGFGDAPHPKEKMEQKEKMELCVSHMQVLLEFIDTDLAATILLRQQIGEATIETISFKNLWHLFPPGTLVFSQQRNMRDNDELSYPRAFRVFGVSGGRVNLGNRPQTGSMPGTKKSDQDEPPTRLVEKFRLDLHYVDFDGSHIGAEMFRKLSVIRPFDGEKKILDLDFYPAQFDPETKEKRSMMIERGQKFVQFLSESHQMYKGFSTGADPEEVHGEVVVDARTGYRMGDETTPLKELDIDYLVESSTSSDDTFELTNCFMKGCRECTNNFADHSYEIRRTEHYVSGDEFAKKLWIPTERDQIEDEHLLLLPRDVLCFVFRSRTWKYLSVEHLKSIDEVHAHRDSGLDQLVMNDEHKKMVLALVESHSSGVRSRGAYKDNETSMDLVKGKGKGLVILLHGAPGVGKTLTAETIAAYTRRPLYPITCGDIGETAVEVERKLEQHFKLAHLWGCVLLLDEADVFLAQRHESDVKRNALVSVFLRTLEYYSGILFLTTNRLGTIDEAFHSRIKIAIYYPRLDETSTIKIWQTCLERMKKMNADPDTDVQIEFEESKILDFARKHYTQLKDRDEQSTWNGRQIRNAFQTAVALAKYDRQQKIQEAGLSQKEAMKKKKKYRTAKLRHQHFKRVSDVMQEYDQYVEKMHDSTGPDDWAAEQDLRAPSTNSIEENPQPSPRARFAQRHSFESTPSPQKRPPVGSKRSSTRGVAQKPKAPLPASEPESASEDDGSSEEEEESDEE